MVWFLWIFFIKNYHSTQHFSKVPIQRIWKNKSKKHLCITMTNFLSLVCVLPIVTWQSHVSMLKSSQVRIMTICLLYIILKCPGVRNNLNVNQWNICSKQKGCRWDFYDIGNAFFHITIQYSKTERLNCLFY